MSIYYYTPFKCTDDNERVTWNLCLKWGAKFADCAQGQPPLEPRLKTVENLNRRKFITPDELADKLVADGLPNGEFNVLLVVCFGAGPHAMSDEFKPWSMGSGAQNGFAKMSIAKSLAMGLGRRNFASGAGGPWKGRVGGFVGPTYTKGGSFQVVLPGGPNEKKTMEDAWSHVHWYDASGASASPFPPNGFQAGKGMTGLSELKDGDSLRIMGHGDWKGGGRILPFAGEVNDELQSMEVDRPARMAGRPDDRKIVDTTIQSDGAAFAKKKLQGFGLMLATNYLGLNVYKGQNRVVVGKGDGGKLDFAIFDKDGKGTIRGEGELRSKSKQIAEMKVRLEPLWSKASKDRHEFGANDAGIAEIVESVGVILGWGGAESKF